MMRAIPFFLLFLLALTGVLFAQADDTLFVRDYIKQNDVELYNGYNSTRLHFRTAGKTEDVFNFFSNNGLFTGVYLDYKWLNIGYGINVPFTSRDNAVKGFKAYRLHFNTYYHGWGASGSSDIYKGLLSQSYRSHYTPVDGVKYTSISADFFHVANASQYSYKTAQYLGQQQIKSCGSFLYHIRPYYYALNLQTSPTPVSDSIKEVITGNPRWLSIVGSVAYGYNFVWKAGKFIVSPYTEFGLGGLYQFGIENKLKAAAIFRAVLTGGYTTPQRYTYLTIETINSTNVLASSTLSDDRLLFSITTGIRLANLKHRVLGLL